MNIKDKIAYSKKPPEDKLNEIVVLWDYGTMETKRKGSFKRNQIIKKYMSKVR